MGREAHGRPGRRRDQDRASPRLSRARDRPVLRGCAGRRAQPPLLALQHQQARYHPGRDDRGRPRPVPPPRRHRGRAHRLAAARRARLARARVRGAERRQPGPHHVLDHAVRAERAVDRLAHLGPHPARRRRADGGVWLRRGGRARPPADRARRRQRPGTSAVTTPTSRSWARCSTAASPARASSSTPPSTMPARSRPRAA